MMVEVEVEVEDDSAVACQGRKEGGVEVREGVAKEAEEMEEGGKEEEAMGVVVAARVAAGEEREEEVGMEAAEGEEGGWVEGVETEGGSEGAENRQEAAAKGVVEVKEEVVVAKEAVEEVEAGEEMVEEVMEAVAAEVVKAAHKRSAHSLAGGRQTPRSP